MSNSSFENNHLSSTAWEEKLSELESRLEYVFITRSLLSEAMTHSSYIRWIRTSGSITEPLENIRCNERLEFLGDAVLDLVVSKGLFKLSRQASEGDLSKARAQLVCEEALAAKGTSLGIPDLLRVGMAELRDGLPRRASVIANAMEALMAAIFLDGGYEAVDQVILECFAGEFENGLEALRQSDFKTGLQEHIQAAFKEVPEYFTEAIHGEAHDPLFEVSVRFRGDILATGFGSSKKKASQAAAKDVLDRIQKGSLKIEGETRD